MDDLRGKTAVITGGASGIGLAMAYALGMQGMGVMLADIEEAAMLDALHGLRDRQIRAEGLVTDVTKPHMLRAVAQKAVATFGKIHILCNNAGVISGGPLGTIPGNEWRWVLDVNIMGIVHGMEILVPLIESHGEGGHVVNTASIVGVISPPNVEPYSASKAAVVAMSEGWAAQLKTKNIGLSILCPGMVRTRIDDSRRNRQDEYGGEAVVATGADPAIPGDLMDAVWRPDRSPTGWSRRSRATSSMCSPILSTRPFAQRGSRAFSTHSIAQLHVQLYRTCRRAT